MFSPLRVLAGARVERGSMRSRFLRGVATDFDVNFTIWLTCAFTKIPFVLKLGWNFLSYPSLSVQNWETTEDVCGIAKRVKKERDRPVGYRRLGGEKWRLLTSPSGRGCSHAVCVTINMASSAGWQQHHNSEDQLILWKLAFK